jgi:hypothetical protein
MHAHRDGDDVALDRAQRLVAQSHALRRAGAQILDEDIRYLGQLLHEPPPFLAFHAELDAVLAWD